MAMAPIVGDTKWSPMLPPAMTGPLGIQQLRPSSFPSVPFGAVASGENVYRQPDMNLYSTGRSPLVVPVRVRKFYNNNIPLQPGHPVEHGQLVKVIETQDRAGTKRQVDLLVGGYAYGLNGIDTIILTANGWGRTPGGDLVPGVYTIREQGAVIQFTVDSTAQPGNINLNIMAAGHDFANNATFTRPASDFGGAGGVPDLEFQVTVNGNYNAPSYWAIVSETVYIHNGDETVVALSVEGTELLKFSDDTLSNIVTDRPTDLSRQNATVGSTAFMYQPLAVDPEEIKFGRVQFALVSFPFQAHAATSYSTPDVAVPTNYADAFADLPTTATKTEAAETGIRVVAKLYATKHGGDVPLGCHLAGSEIVHTGVVLHSNDDGCHVACERNSVAAALLESHANPNTHLAARAEFVKTGVPPEHCVSAITNKLLTPEDCEGGLTPHHLDWVGCPDNPRIPGIDEETATKIRDVVQHVAHNRVDLGGAPQGVLDAVAAAVGWG